MTFALAEKSIIVTGASSGIGAAAAKLFAEAGARLTLADLNVEAGEALVRELRNAGASVQFVRTDIAKEVDAQAMVSVAVQSYGRLDGAFNNVGVGYAAKLLHQLDAADWQRAIDINLTGTFFCLKHEIAAMLETGGGAIVNTGSGASVAALETAAEYVSSKHGLLGLTRAAALDYAMHGIRVNAILAGPTATPLADHILEIAPMADHAVQKPSLFDRLGKPVEIAAAALWLLSDAASFVTGTGLPVDGGYLVP